MREIRFRAYQPFTKKMWILNPEDEAVRVTDFVEKIDWKVMQYTGLKDKNDLQIYESDNIDFNGLEYEVVFEHGGWLAKCLTTAPNPDGTESKRPDEWLADFNKRVEVIGNIYENPELLK